MENIWDRYYRLNEALLSFVGLWPFYSSKLILIIKTVLPLVFASTFATQMLAFLTIEFDLLIALKIISFSILPLIYCIKYTFFVIANRRIRDLIMCIQTNWKIFVGPQEHSIIEHYANYARTLTVALASFLYPSAFLGMVWLFLPKLLDVIAPINITRAERLPLDIEVFFDQKKHFNFIAICVNSLIGIGATTLVATESFCMLAIQHACGMFKVAGYRAETVVDESLLKLSICERDSVIRRRIRETVFMHRKALDFAAQIDDTFLIQYFILLGLGIASLTVNLFRLSQALLTVQIEEILLSVSFVVSHLFYMFFCNYMGQIMLDHSSELCDRLYNTPWYVISKSSQRLLLLFMNTMNKSCHWVFGGIFRANIEGFSAIINLSVSYFMVFYSVVK